MSSLRALLQVTISLSLLATSAQAQLQLCFDDQVAYDPTTDLSWVTDYRSAINGGYHTGGQLESIPLGLHVGVVDQAPLVDVHGVTGWRVPYPNEYSNVVMGIETGIFRYTGDCGLGDCTEVAGHGFSNPPWWNVNGAHLHTAQCTDISLTTCGETSHITVHGETYDVQVQGETHGLAWYSQVTTMLVQNGNVCPAAAVPSLGLAGRAVLAAVLMGLAALFLSATVLKHGKFKHG